MVKRFEIWYAVLSPTVGSEINKERPCLVVSPDEANRNLNTVIIVPLTSSLRPYPTRVGCHFMEKRGQLSADQIRSIDKSRLSRKMGALDEETAKKICDKLIETFRY